MLKNMLHFVIFMIYSSVRCKNRFPYLYIYKGSGRCGSC